MAAPWPHAPLLVALCVCALVTPASARAQPAPVSAVALQEYIAAGVRAWEPYVTSQGQIIDPLVPRIVQDNYGSIMLADVMLQISARDRDARLGETGELIIERSLQLPQTNGPFNLLAVAMVIRDGQAGVFAPGVWTRLSGPLMAFATRILPLAKTGGCLPRPHCYSNWRLVWSAAVAQLLASEVPGVRAGVQTLNLEDQANLAMALASVGGAPSPSILQGARELSDPSTEPLSYEIFSSAQLELLAQAQPGTLTPELQEMRENAAHYALQLMAPDGQLSFAGRSLDQSWVQAAGADLGARQAAQDPGEAARWRSFADRAFSYLSSAYVPRSDGIIPIVPGLSSAWSPTIMDPYAAENCYAGMTLWFLMDALQHWPEAAAPRAPVPVDGPNALVGDLHSSGLVWGRSGAVWWAVSGQRTCGGDPRCGQGVVALKLQSASGWRDLIALRPISRALYGEWTLHFANGQSASPRFTSVRGSGHTALLRGSYRDPRGRSLLSIWRITATTAGLKLQMSLPRGATLATNVWLTSDAVPLRAPGASVKEDPCAVTASGPACPVELYWHHGPHATLEIGTGAR